MATALRNTRPEAEPYAFVELQIEKGSGSKIIHQADFGIRTFIQGLKEDVEKMIGIPAEDQKWFYKGILLDDRKTLEDYGVGLTVKTYIIVKTQ